MSKDQFWESFDLQFKYIQPKKLNIGATFDGWYQNQKKGKKGQQFQIRDEQDENLMFPLSGTIKSIFDQMDIQKWDFIRLIYKGEAVIESGDWEGQTCHRWVVKRNPSMSGEMKYREAMGFPCNDLPTTSADESNPNLDGLF